jgi:hypothetical protein
MVIFLVVFAILMAGVLGLCVGFCYGHHLGWTSRGSLYHTMRQHDDAQ